MEAAQISTRVSMLILGLDGAGITTITKKILAESNEVATEKGNDRVPHWQTDTKNIYEYHTTTPWVLNGWDSFCSRLNILIYVLDSNREDYENDKNALSALLEDKAASKHEVPILLYANKQGIPSALAVKDVQEKLQFDSLSSKSRDRILIIPYCAQDTEFMATIASWMKTLPTLSASTKNTRAEKSDKGSKDEIGRLLDADAESASSDE